MGTDAKGLHTAKQMKKINDLYDQSVHYLTKYVSIFEYPPNSQSKERQPVPDEFRDEYFQAHFLMAVMSGKMIARSKESKISQLKKSLSGYEHVVEFYQERGPIEGCEVQNQIASEMKDLLPMKISKIKK